MLQVIINDKYDIEFNDVPKPDFNDDEILIKVKAAGINRADILQRKGQYPPPPGFSNILGLEVAGIVEAVGKSIKDLKAGDQVAALLNAGGYSEYVVAYPEHCIIIPKNLSFEKAAAIPEAFYVAYLNLFWEGELKSGELVYINAAASGVGLAAIQLAKMAGAKVIASAGTDKKVETCKNLGADLAINYKEQNVQQVIEEEYGKHAVNLILDMVAGEQFEPQLSLLSTDSRIVIIGYQSGRNVNTDLAKVLIKRIKIKGSTLRSRSKEFKTKLIQEFKDKCLNKFENQLLMPNLDSVFEFKDLNLAHQRMEANLNIGKIVIKL